MNTKHKIFIFYFLTTIGIFIFLDNYSIYFKISSLILIYAIQRLIYGIGKKIVFFDLMIFLAILQWLFVPAYFYDVYQYDDSFGRSDYYKMAIGEYEYFLYALPATIFMIIGLSYPSKRLNEYFIKELIDKNKKYLSTKPNLDLILLSIGIGCFVLQRIVPGIMAYPFYLGSKLIFVSVLYSQLSLNRYRVLMITIAFIFVLIDVITSGMFGDALFWILATLVVFSISIKMSLSTKIVSFIIGIYLIFLIQSVKFEYRLATWVSSTEKQGSATIFTDLVVNRVGKPFELLNKETVYLMCVRLNQGRVVSIIMDYVPKHEPFAKGETIVTALISGFIPRFIWSGKPKAGGASNVSRFCGDDSLYTNDQSYNLSTLGEAYANFGKFFGIIFMFFFGLFLNRLLSFFLYIANKQSTLLLWVVFIFFGTMSVEGEVLGIVNTITMGSIFTFMAYFIFEKISQRRIMLS